MGENQTIFNDLDQLLREPLKCGICLEVYTNPKFVGSCHHTFCSECVEGVVQSNIERRQFCCPICRKSYPIPEHGAADLQNDFKSMTFIRALDTLHERLQGRQTADSGITTCRVCRVGPAVRFCERCGGGGLHLCLRCSQKHAENPATAQHEVLLIAELCETHEEPLKLYCLKCKKRICHVCLISEHTGARHEVRDRSVVVNQMKNQLEQSFAESIELKKRLEVSRLAVRSIARTVIENAEKEKIERRQKSQDLQIKVTQVERELGDLLQLKAKLLKSIGDLQNSGASEWDLASEQLRSLKEDLTASRTELDVSQKKALGIKNVDFTTIKGEDQLIATGSELKKVVKAAANVVWTVGLKLHPCVNGDYLLVYNR